MRALLTSTALALALGLGTAAWAQDTGGTSSDNDKGGTTGMMTTTPRDASDDAIGTRGTQMGGGAGSAVDPAVGQGSTMAQDSELGQMRGEQVIGQTLYGAQGEEIGEIQDVVVSQDGSKPEFVVGVGGFLGIGERNVTVPIDQVQLQGDRLTTSMTRESIEGLQPYEEGSRQSWGDRALGG